MITEAIILAGGLGTRLREAVPELPKCMAPIAGRPFVAYVIDYLRKQGIQRFVFSLGYKSEAVEVYLAHHYSALNYISVIEDEPLGTGGAICLALQKTITEDVLIANGDTFFGIDVNEISSFHSCVASECTLALKPLEHFDRYGAVGINQSGRIISFKEKQFYDKGLINGGIYLLKRMQFLNRSFSEKFSFEKEYLEKYIAKASLNGFIQEGYFIDIGIPLDYEKAQMELESKIV